MAVLVTANLTDINGNQRPDLLATQALDEHSVLLQTQKRQKITGAYAAMDCMLNERCQHLLKSQKLLVLAGGFGTRLQSVVADVPKPMAPVGDSPFIEHLIRCWYQQGVRDFTFLLHHMADVIKAYVNSTHVVSLGNCQVTFICEPEPLGTGGAIAYAVKKLGLEGGFLVANADTYLETGLAALSECGNNALCTVYVEQTGRYGKLELSEDKVTAFSEKANSVGGGWINAGLCRLDSHLFEGWDGQAFSLEQQIFPRLVDAEALHCIKLDCPFIDIGIPEDYRRFCRWIELEKKEQL